MNGHDTQAESGHPMEFDHADYPNQWGLKAADFDYDSESYGAALAFLGDVSIGTDEASALVAEGATQEMLRGWESLPRFRRALGQCREMGEQDRAFQQRQQEELERNTSGAPGSVPGFIPLDQMPVRRPSVFSSTPDAGSFGDGSLNHLPGEVNESTTEGITR